MKKLLLVVGLLFASDIDAATKNIWLSQAEISALPTTGLAWDNVYNSAWATWPTANINDAQNVHSGRTVGGALVWARQQDPAMRAKVRDAIIAAKRTFDAPSEYTGGGGGASVLCLARQLGGYAIAADLIDLEAYDSTADTEFRAWLDTIRTTIVYPNGASGGCCSTLVMTHEKIATNWADWAGASAIAAALYLGDNARVAHAALVLRAFLGERSIYPPDIIGQQDGYFIRTSNWQPSWICGTTTTWTAINGSCLKSGVDVDGAVAEDIGRSGPFAWPPGADGMTYSWESLCGLFVQAEMLYRAGYPAYGWSNQALKRAMDFMVRAGWQMNFAGLRFVPWIANHRYGTSYLTFTGIPSGRLMGWTDWTHSGQAVISVDDPPASGSVAQTLFRVAEARERRDLYDLSGRKVKASVPGVYFQRIVGKAGVVTTRRVVVVQ